MLLDDFDYNVPEELVAQAPLANREASRLLVLHRKTGAIEHRKFTDLAEYLTPKDILIFNQSRVIKARILGHRPSGGKVEVFLLKKIATGRFECLVKATATQKDGMEFTVGETLQGKISKPNSDSMIHEVKFLALESDIDSLLEKFGSVPLPPYIHREANVEDASRYQTVYAANPGSVAAPTAGLHFTKSYLEKLQKQGIAMGWVTLHVGLGTFQPIKVPNILDHKMHSESFEVTDTVWNQCLEKKQVGGRVIAVGTTSVRSLESRARGIKENTELFLKPGDDFKIVDAMLTNFHQPKSTLVVMLSAFVGKEKLFEVYRKAVEEKYRFFSYGDAMLVL